jgi:hypothetical protein
MRRVIVTYKLKRERVAEHEALITAVFAELEKRGPGSIRYGAFKQPDGVSYAHIAFIEGDQNPLQAIQAFKAFTAKVEERCEVAPTTIELTTVGAYKI